jgi:hypothetical protein
MIWTSGKSICASWALLLTLCMGCLWAQHVYAGATIEERVRASMERDKRARLKGWKKIIFLCSATVSSTPKIMVDRICERTNTNAKFLAASTNTQMQIAKGYYGIALGKEQDMLPLEVEFYSSGCDGSICSIRVDVSASFSYAKAVDLAAPSYFIDEKDRQVRRDSPASIPRPIEAFMWGPRGLIASGIPGEELAGVVANGIDSLLKEFFADYVNANRE